MEISPQHSKIRAIKLWQHLDKADHKSVKHKALFSNTTSPNKNTLTQFALHVKNNADIRHPDNNSHNNNERHSVELQTLPQNYKTNKDVLHPTTSKNIYLVLSVAVGLQSNVVTFIFYLHTYNDAYMLTSLGMVIIHNLANCSGQ